jgi:hypothetical protein
MRNHVQQGAHGGSAAGIEYANILQRCESTTASNGSDADPDGSDEDPGGTHGKNAA